MIQRMLTNWFLVPLPFLNPAWTSGSSWFTYYWSLAWRILRITLLVCEMNYFQNTILNFLWVLMQLLKKKIQIFFLVFIFVPVNKNSVNSQRRKEKILFRPSSGVYAKRQTLRNLQELFCLLEVEGAVIHIFEKKALCIRWHTGI